MCSSPFVCERMCTVCGWKLFSETSSKTLKFIGFMEDCCADGRTKARESQGKPHTPCKFDALRCDGSAKSINTKPTTNLKPYFTAKMSHVI